MKAPIDYFFQTAPKEWRILEAISVYDKLKRYDSFGSLLEAMQRDIGRACEKQPTFKKKGKLFVEIVEVIYKNIKKIKRKVIIFMFIFFFSRI
jgi:hypothetical protein